MAETQSNGPRRPANPLLLGEEACNTDNVALMEEAISLASNPNSRVSAEKVTERGLRSCVAERSVNVLNYILELDGVDISKLPASTVMALDQHGASKPPYDVLEILLKHGWDIDTRAPQRTNFPLLWYATKDSELVGWCLEHGASVYLPGDTPPQDSNGVGAQARMTVLEKAATDATVATFEKLRARDAPLGRRTLHQAVWHAAIKAPKIENDDKTLFNERMTMVRHLVDEVKLDVNADGGHAGTPANTPLWNVANRNDGRDTRELIWFLLDRGADPTRAGEALSAGGSPTASPLEEAQSNRNTLFVEAVREWEEQRGERSY